MLLERISILVRRRHRVPFPSRTSIIIFYRKPVGLLQITSKRKNERLNPNPSQFVNVTFRKRIKHCRGGRESLTVLRTPMYSWQNSRYTQQTHPHPLYDAIILSNSGSMASYSASGVWAVMLTRTFPAPFTASVAKLKIVRK